MRRDFDIAKLENFVKRSRRRRIMKRGLALLSALVVLCTMNTLKRAAVAIEHIPTCGYEYEHVHTAECFDEQGALICPLHEHTDACYQETPDTGAILEQQEFDLGGDEDYTEFEDAQVPMGDAEADADDETNDDAEADADAETNDAEASDAEASETPAFDMNGAQQALLSEILAATGMELDRSTIQMVGLVADAGEDNDVIAIALVDDDISITAQRDFDAVEIAIINADGVFTVKLLNGAVPQQDEETAVEQAESDEENEEENEEESAEPKEALPVEEPDGNEGEETIEQTDVEIEGDADDTEEQTEVGDEAEDNTDENVEENIDENAEENVEENTDENTDEIIDAVEDADENADENINIEETADSDEEEGDVEADTDATDAEENEEQAEAVEQAEESEENQEEAEEESEENKEESVQAEENNEEAEEESEENKEESVQAEENSEEAEEESEENEEEAEKESEENKEEAEQAEENNEEAEEESKENEEEAEEESEENKEEAEQAEENNEEAEEESEENEEEAEEESEENKEEAEEESEQAEENQEESEGNEEQAEVDMATLYPAQTFEGSAGNVHVSVTAEAGAFPADTEMRVTRVWDDETLGGIADAVTEDFVEVKKVMAVDIAFFNAEDEEIEPLLPISVVMTVDELEENQDAVVVHMDDEGNAELVEQTDAPQTEDAQLALNVELPAAENAEALTAQILADATGETAEAEEVADGDETAAEDNSEDAADETAAEDNSEDAADETAAEDNSEDAADETAAEDNSEDTAVEGIPAEDAADETADADDAADENADAADENADADDDNADAQPVIEYGDEAAAPVADAAVGDGLDVVAEAAPTESIAFEADSFSVYAVVVTETIETRYIAADGQSYIISVGYGPEAQIPAGAELRVQEITGEENAEAYGWYTQKCVEAVDLAMFNPLTFARVFDIEILSEGEKIEPAAEVSVSIRLADAPQMNDDTSVKVVHFEIENGPVVLDPEADENADLHFNTASFSVYAVIAYNGNPTSVNDLGGRSCTINHNGNYMTSQMDWDSNPDKIKRSSSLSDAAVWHFEATDQPGQYYIYTGEGDDKKYIQVVRDNATDGDWHIAHARLQDASNGYRSVFTANQSGDDYQFFATINNVAYYLNDWGDGSGYAAYAWSDAPESKLTLDFSTTYKNKRYAVVAKKKGTNECYSVQNDGSLKAVTYDADLNRVTLGSPRLWEYTTVDGKTVLRHEEEGYAFDDRQLSTKHTYAYIDPANSEGVYCDEIQSTFKNTIYYDKDGDGYKESWVTFDDTSDDQIKWVDLNDANVVLDEQHRIHNSNGRYVAVHENADGSVKFAGDCDASDEDVNAWEFYLAEVNTMPETHHWLTNTVSHIDIGIVGGANVTVPIPYGRYRNEASEVVIINKNQRVKLENKDVSVTTEDIKGAEITAFKKDGDVVVPANDVFYITGYSANKETGKSHDQVRIEGVFTVAQGESLDNLMENGSINEWAYRNNFNSYRDQVNAARLEADNRIYYSVILTKPVEFELTDEDGNPLYKEELDANGELVPATITVNLTLSASFDYWDPHNECPPIYESRYYSETWSKEKWEGGAIWDQDGSGMDFILGASAQEDRGTFALQITKMIEDENGNPIKLAEGTRIENAYDICKNGDADANSVIGLNVGGYEFAVSHEGYNKIDEKSTVIGQNGIGVIYVFDLSGGMYTIREHTDISSLPLEIVDADGETWNYKETRILTEYVKRGDVYDSEDDPMHYSMTYTECGDNYYAVPEVLGRFTKVNGETETEDYLEYFVHNVYVPSKTELTVEKKWINGDAPTGATVDVVLKRCKLVKNGGITPPNPTAATLVIRDGCVGLSGDRTYGASYTVTGPNDYSRVFNWNGSDIVIENLPLGEYTIEKQATEQSGYNMAYGALTRTEMLRATGKTVVFQNTDYTPVASTLYHNVVVKTVNQPDSPNQNGEIVFQSTTFQDGSTLIFKVGAASWNQYSYTVTCNGQNWGSFSASQPMNRSFVLNEDVTIIIEGFYPHHNTWLNPTPSVSMAPSTSNALTNGANAAPKFMRSAPRMMSAAASAPQTLVLENSASLPEAPQDYTWQEDTTWCDGEGYPVHLSDGHWSETVDELDKQDSFGNVYAYYIASVTEQGMPSGMTAKIDVSGDARMLVYGDHKTNEEHDNGTLSVTNTLPTKTSIRIKKTDLNGTLLTGAHFKLLKDGVQYIADIAVTDGYSEEFEVEVGHYELVETQFPTGYVKTGGNPEFDVTVNGASKEVEVTYNKVIVNEVTVENEPGVSLPSTGGAGTGAYTAGGAALALLAVALLLMKRRQA